MRLPVPAHSSTGGSPPYGVQSALKRADTAYEIRVNAAKFERERELPKHVNNGDETLPDRIGSYSKGLAHDNTGVVNAAAYQKLLDAVSSGKPADFQAIPLGGNVKFVNPQAGLAFDLEGADSHALALPPAWKVLSEERAAEAVELYWMALCRDIPFDSYGTEPLTTAAITELNKINHQHFQGKFFPVDGAGHVTAHTLFRGKTPGELSAGYVSQFFLQKANFGALALPKDGAMQDGQLYNVYAPGVDYMTDQASWLAVQNGQGQPNPANPNFPFGPNDPLGPRYLFSGRCGAAFVHVDELYQAYFMAALDLLDQIKVYAYDKKNPYRLPNKNANTQMGFGTFGNPHVATLVAEVATRALKAQWFQKWFVHRTLRPEEYGGLVHFTKTGQRNVKLPALVLNSQAVNLTFSKFGSFFMPMAFPEGSPMHPSYGSGHATVAGACATIIKAFFDEDLPVVNPVQVVLDPSDPSNNGMKLMPYSGPVMTVGHEANKIAGNVGMFRNHAGVHWRSDHEQSILLGEQIGLSILQDQKWLYNEGSHNWDLTLFDGKRVTI